VDVSSVEQKPGIERPAPPFTTSTLTQEASRKLGFSTERTMQSAQRLFQGVDVGNGEMEGLITYHRTDSTTLSDKALQESARVIREMFGGEYYERAAPVSDARQKRPGSARSDSSDRLPPCAQPARTGARQRRPENLRADLEANDGVTDG
jgi:DNA topoisomerase-1